MRGIGGMVGPFCDVKRAKYDRRAARGEPGQVRILELGGRGTSGSTEILPRAAIFRG